MGTPPNSILPLFSAATLLQIQSGPDKIRPISIGQALCRLVTLVLLQRALAESREHLALERQANGLRTDMDAIAHDARMRLKRHRRKDTHVLVSIVGTNAFNQFSRQQNIELLPPHAPSLAQFINMIYGRAPPSLFIPSHSPSCTTPSLLASREGSLQG